MDFDNPTDAALETIANELVKDHAEVIGKTRVQAVITAETAQRYYEMRNDILKIRRTKSNGLLGEARGQRRIPSAFFPSIVDQKYKYVLANPFSVAAKDEKEQEYFDDYFDAVLRNQVKELLKDTIKVGTGALLLYKDDSDVVRFEQIPITQFKCVYDDNGILSAVMRIYYIQSRQDDGTLKDIKVINWHTENVFIEVREVDGVAERKDSAGLGFIPYMFLEFENIISKIKDLIDAYDILASNAITALDVSTLNTILILKGYKGLASNVDKGAGKTEGLRDVVDDIGIARSLLLDKDGAADTLALKAELEYYDSELTRLRKEIYAMAGAVDFDGVNFGLTSGVALDRIYATLDIDTTILQTQLNYIMSEIAKLNGKKDVEIIFNVSRLYNKAEQAAYLRDKVDALMKFPDLLDRVKIVKMLLEEYNVQDIEDFFIKGILCEEHGVVDEHVGGVNDSGEVEVIKPNSDSVDVAINDEGVVDSVEGDLEDSVDLTTDGRLDSIEMKLDKLFGLLDSKKELVGITQTINVGTNDVEVVPNESDENIDAQ